LGDWAEFLNSKAKASGRNCGLSHNG
jgi:hypothetical protein